MTISRIIFISFVVSLLPLASFASVCNEVFQLEIPGKIANGELVMSGLLPPYTIPRNSTDKVILDSENPDLLLRDLAREALDYLQGTGGVDKINGSTMYSKIDLKYVELANAVTLRLKNTMDARYFDSDGKTSEIINVPGLGTLTVKFTMSDSSIIYISEIKGPGFSFYNIRRTGRSFGNSFDISLPADLIITPLKTRIKMYSDSSGTFVSKGDLEYTNTLVNVFGSGRKTDALNDQLYVTSNSAKNQLGVTRSYNDNDSGNRDYIKRINAASGGRPFELSWNAEQQKAIDWLQQNVLSKVKSMPVVHNPNRQLPALREFPNHFKDLYTWIPVRDAKKIIEKIQSTETLESAEMAAIKPQLRLVNLNVKGDFDRVANDAFVYVSPRKSSKEEHLNSRFHFSSGDGYVLARVKPISSRNAFVVDWARKDEFNKNLSDEQRNKLIDNSQFRGSWQVAIAQSMVKIGDYREGSFEKPVVIFSRDLEIDEVQLMDVTVGTDWLPSSEAGSRGTLN